MSDHGTADRSGPRGLAYLLLAGGVIGTLALLAAALRWPSDTGILVMLVFPLAMVLAAARLGLASVAAQPKDAPKGRFSYVAVAIFIAGAMWVGRDTFRTLTQTGPSPDRDFAAGIGLILIVSLAYGAFSALRETRGPARSESPPRRLGLYLSFFLLALLLCFAPLIPALLLAPTP